MSKSKLIAVFASGAVLVSQIGIATPAYAAAYYGTHIYASSSLVSSPSHIDAKDSGNLTAFLPLFYVNQALAKFGITGTWNGNNWNLTLPQGMNADTSNPQSGQQTNSSTLAMSINGQVVQYAPRQVAGDPANGGQSTTYLPIWYIDQVIGRLSIQATWDGTNWKMTKTTPETQQAMANAMWNTFAGVNWDVNAHPSISSVGISPSATSPVTASDVATYLADWAAKAKGYTLQSAVEGTSTGASGSTPAGTFVPFSLQYESSTDPFTWANENDLFEGTSVSSSSSVITLSEVNQILSNLQWWLKGSREVNGVYQLHVPMYGNFILYSYMVYTNQTTDALYRESMADAAHYFDEVKVTVSGNTLKVALPNTANSASNMCWQIVDGDGYHYGWNGSGTVSSSRGGATLSVPNNGEYFVVITNSLNANLNGYDVGYKNVNGQPQFIQPVDGANEQS